MQERKGVITFKGNPMTLLGPEIKAGDKAPDFRVVDTGLAPVTLADFKGKVKIISAVPSLDTPTCDTETRRFNQEAAKLPGNVVVLTVSLDLPFAQKRWCAAAGIDKVKTLSDYQDRSFASAYGVLIKELKLPVPVDLRRRRERHGPVRPAREGGVPGAGLRRGPRGGAGSPVDRDGGSRRGRPERGDR